MGKYGIFAAVSDQGTNKISVAGWIFYIRLTAYVCKDIRLLKSYVRYPHLMCLVPWSEIGRRAAFPLLNALIFQVQMTREMKNYGGAKNSNAIVTPDCESVDRSVEGLDFSGFSDYLNRVIEPRDLAKYLREIREYYLEMALYVLLDYVGMDTGGGLPHEGIQDHVFHLSKLIDLFESL
jgi:hypothetical protein